jgi:transposase
VHASEQDRRDVARKRERWRSHQHKIEPSRLVFIDETAAKTNMTRTCGRWAKGQRLVAKVPHGRWSTLTFIAALRFDRIDAPMVLDRPMNGLWFRTWIEQMLVPTLSKGDVVVLDNLASHKSKAVRQAVRKAGAHLIFLPPYSPDLNPIELVFAKLKALLRRADERTKENVWKRIGRLLDRFSPSECSNYLRHAGYASS